jgi:hypothetical protein
MCARYGRRRTGLSYEALNITLHYVAAIRKEVRKCILGNTNFQW